MTLKFQWVEFSDLVVKCHIAAEYPLPFGNLHLFLKLVWATIKNMA